MPKTAKKKRVKKSDEHGVVLLSESIDFGTLLALPSSSFRKNSRNNLLLYLNSFIYINLYLISVSWNHINWSKRLIPPPLYFSQWSVSWYFPADIFQGLFPKQQDTIAIRSKLAINSTWAYFHAWSIPFTKSCYLFKQKFFLFCGDNIF